MTTMKAIVWTAYGPPSVLKVQDVNKPKVGPDTVLVKVKCAGVAAGDCEMRSQNMPFIIRAPMRLISGIMRPARIPVLGQQFSGEVTEVGNKVTAFKIGDRVFGTAGISFGAYAQYVAVPERPKDGSYLGIVPANISFAEASVASLSAMEAISFLGQAGLKEGERVLVIGAGGNIGSFAVQLAKSYFKASYVAAVDSTNKMAMLKAVGADKTIDFMSDKNYLKTSETFDVILDVPGKSSFAQCEPCLNDGGRYIMAMFGGSELLQSALVPTGSKKMMPGMSKYLPQDFITISRLLEESKIKSVVDRVFPFEEAVAAHTYAESGDKAGCIALQFDA
ncbi:chaperonin 10-like protein [Chytriomyces sp. MP71]|nr:chaperonin 10-like protein [Chytriomyces sp. MP71]